MSHRQLAPSSYRNLVAEILRIYDRTRQSLIQGHWEIGKTIVEIEQDGASRAAYGKKILSQVSRDLTRERGPGFSLTNLKRFRRFYRAPKRPTSAQLGWSHHAELEVVRDAGERRSLEKRVIREGLSCHELRALIRAIRRKRGRPKPGAIDVTPLLPRKGPLHTYRIVTPEDVGWPATNASAGRPDRGVLLLDLGFRFYKAFAGAVKAGDIVELRGKKILKAVGAKKPGYTYRAYLQKVIDGDTCWVALDAGLEMIAHLKLRLRGIDCLEIKTSQGQAAKRFVESLLKDAPFLTVCSSKNDKYDRYEADVFLEDKTGKEVFLNNLLLETGHAVRMDD